MSTRSQRLILMAVLIILFFFSGVAFAIEVSGDVSGIWGPEDNPYLVVGDLRVPPSQSLIIEPGCRIEFQGHYRFIVDSMAIFRAIGTEIDSIIFTSENTVIGWNGIRFLWADSSCELAYCRLEWGRGNENHNLDDSLSLGGAVFLRGGALSIRNSHLHFNRALEGYGGAIYSEQSDLSVSESVLDSNKCAWGGSAIYATYSNVIIENNSIFNDSTWYPLGGEHGGGAVGCRYSNVEISHNIIENNFCGMSGGGLSLATSEGIVNDNIVRYNVAFNYGGGMAVGGASCLISYNLIYGNEVYLNGGGAACGNGSTFINNTILYNQSGGPGGGIRYWTDTIPDTFANNIIWGNVSHDSSQIYLWNGCPSPITIYNDIQGGWAGEGNIDSDPLFAGPDDFHLTWANYPLEDSTKSPCIDSGDPSSPPDSDGTRADMGAFPFDRRTHGIDDDFGPPIRDFIFLHNYPNPFNSSTTISFILSKEEHIALNLYDIAGRKVAVVDEGIYPAGSHSLNLDMKDYASGIYYLILDTDDSHITRKMVMIK